MSNLTKEDQAEFDEWFKADGGDYNQESIDLAEAAWKAACTQHTEAIAEVERVISRALPYLVMQMDHFDKPSLSRTDIGKLIDDAEDWLKNHGTDSRGEW